MWSSILLTILGFILLIYGGDRICFGASAIAVRLGISHFVVGMTIVALSTSAPEFLTSIIATIQGHPELVVGNVVGSNLVNIGIAGGFTALIYPFTLTSRMVKIEMFFLWIVTCIFGFMALHSSITRFVGFTFCLIGILYLRYLGKSERDKFDEEKTRESTPTISLKQAVWTFILGLALLIVGARIVVDHSIVIARQLGWSDTLIGLTIVAIGTSLPEIVTSLVAAFRGYGTKIGRAHV
jgi:cation:H+ antiporter